MRSLRSYHIVKFALLKQLFCYYFDSNFDTLEPPVIAPFQFPSDTVDEGRYGQITCSVVSGDEPLQISWSLHGDVISSDPSIITTMIGTRSSILIISQVGYRHSGEYTCRATNKAGTATHSATLRVNGDYLNDKRVVR